MAHFARIDENNVVRQVIVVANGVIENKEFPESEPIGIAFCKETFGQDTNWLQTSCNSNFRGIFATPPAIYDPVKDEFIDPFDTE
jgi:hypothetical protein